MISQYRNLLHHFVHQNGNREASTFWAGCGAIRRSVFEKIGGFDEKRFRRPSIEDIELGYRLRQSGYRILLDKRLQGTHLKGWNLYSLIRTDISCRAMPWSRLILETKKLPDDLNLKLGQRVSFCIGGTGLCVRSRFDSAAQLASWICRCSRRRCHHQSTSLRVLYATRRHQVCSRVFRTARYLLSLQWPQLCVGVVRVSSPPGCGFLFCVRPQPAKIATAGTLLNKMSRIGTENQTHDPRA